MRERILVVNPGSTSTKMALYEGEREQHAYIVRHSPADLRSFQGIWGQFDYRVRAVSSWVHALSESVDAVVGIGGLLRPLPGGTYDVNARMLSDAKANLQGEHASNLGCAMADELARIYHCPALIVDPVSVDEFEALARLSGHPLIHRRSLSHALNIHTAARRAAQELAVPLKDTTFVVAHLGGGISIAPVRGGRIIDVNDAASDGPYSPERTGGLPLQDFITLCYSGSHSEQQMRSLVMGRGGLVAYLGTNSGLESEQRIKNGDDHAKEVYEGMAYQIAKEIGAMATVLKGRVDAVVLTGGLASSTMLVEWIGERVRFLGPLLTFEGEDEMRSLALGALRVLRNEEQQLEY